jgi:hypothetical protein
MLKHFSNVHLLLHYISVNCMNFRKPNIVVPTCRKASDGKEMCITFVQTRYCLLHTDLRQKTNTTHRPYTEDVRTCINTVVVSSIIK